MRPPLVPPPEYTGDQPTVPNPIYREPGKPAGTASRRGAGGTSTTAGARPASTDDGRRGNVVMSLMLVVGLVITGAAGIMLSSANGNASEEAARTTPADSGAGAGMPLAVARPEGSDDGEGSAESGDGEVVVAGSPVDDSPSDFGQTVSLPDGVEVTMGTPQSFTPSSEAGVDGDEFLSVEVTVVNGADRSYEVHPTVQLLDDLSDLEAPGGEGGADDAGSGPSSGYESVRDPGSGLTASWSGAEMSPGGTAYGIFGFAVPGEAPDEIYGVVWIDAGEDELLYVSFTGPRP